VQINLLRALILDAILRLMPEDDKNNDDRDVPTVVADAFDKAMGCEKFGGVIRSDRYKLCGEAKCDYRSVVKFLRGESIFPSTAQRIQLAAQKLGIKVPTRLILP